MILTTKKDFENAVLKGKEIKTSTVFYTGELTEKKDTPIGTYVKDKGIYCGISPDDGKPFYLALHDEAEKMTWDEAMKKWRIPSKKEWFLILINKEKIEKGLEEAGGDTFENKWYWSSTEVNNYGAWVLHPSNSDVSYDSKHDNGLVRCIFAF